MLPAAIGSGSSGLRSTSASSIAAESPAIDPPAPMCAAISASITGRVQSPIATDAPSSISPESSRNPTSGRSVPSSSSAAGAPNPTFQPIGRAPAVQPLAPQREHRAGAALDPRVKAHASNSSSGPGIA